MKFIERNRIMLHLWLESDITHLRIVEVKMASGTWIPQGIFITAREKNDQNGLR